MTTTRPTSVSVSFAPQRTRPQSAFSTLQSAVGNRQSSIGNRQFSSAFTLIELLATLFIVAVIVTVTAVMLKETRLTSSRLSENEESSHSAARALELMRRDIERAVADTSFSNFVFVATNGFDAGTLSAADITAAPGSTTLLYPADTNASRLCMLVLDESATVSTSNRAVSEVFYYLACTPTSACATLLRAVVPLDTVMHPGAYTNPLWYAEPTPTNPAPEVVVRYVTAFSAVCTATNGAAPPEWISNQLPVSVDLSLSYLPESAARRLRARGTLTNDAEVAKVLTTLSGRVFLPNRRGYMDGK